MQKILLILSLLGILVPKPLWAQALFPIYENGRYGFINSEGTPVITPRFRAVGNFSEGLVPARENGLYGYIDHNGNYVISPNFDYATSFSEGLAIVYQGTTPICIDHNGHTVFTSHFAEIDPFRNGHALITTDDGKQGIINRQGKLVGTLYSYISPFTHGLATVAGLGLDHNRSDAMEKQVALIDSTGKILVPFGKYAVIDPYKRGYCQALSEDAKHVYFLDTKGNVLLEKKDFEHASVVGYSSDGILRLELYKYWIPEKKGVSRCSEKNYVGYLNLRGDTIFSDTNFVDGDDFSCNRAFVQHQNRKYYLLDNQGNINTSVSFNRVMDYSFTNGLAFVQKNTGWCVIDTNGNEVSSLSCDDVDLLGTDNRYFYFTVYPKPSSDNALYGICNQRGKVLIRPIMQEFDRYGFWNGVLACKIEGKKCYIDTTGKKIYSAPWSFQMDSLNIDFMNSGYIGAPYEVDKSDPDYEEMNKFMPEKYESGVPFPQGQIGIRIEEDSLAVWEEKYYAHRLYIYNNSDQDIEFNAQDRRLYAKVQALDPNGVWRDIEYLPRSFCGNSYHTQTLKKGKYWDDLIPRYAGSFKTKIRVELKYIDPKAPIQEGGRYTDREIILYSNEMDAGINPAQFWRKKQYHPYNIMDPYNQ